MVFGKTFRQVFEFHKTRFFSYGGTDAAALRSSSDFMSFIVPAVYDVFAAQ
jgi:hypothetical protein